MSVGDQINSIIISGRRDLADCKAGHSRVYEMKPQNPSVRTQLCDHFRSRQQLVLLYLANMLSPSPYLLLHRNDFR